MTINYYMYWYTAIFCLGRCNDYFPNNFSTIFFATSRRTSIFKAPCVRGVHQGILTSLFEKCPPCSFSVSLNIIFHNVLEECKWIRPNLPFTTSLTVLPQRLDTTFTWRAAAATAVGAVLCTVAGDTTVEEVVVARRGADVAEVCRRWCASPRIPRWHRRRRWSAKADVLGARRWRRRRRWCCCRQNWKRWLWWLTNASAAASTAAAAVSNTQPGSYCGRILLLLFFFFFSSLTLKEIVRELLTRSLPSSNGCDSCSHFLLLPLLHQFVPGFRYWCISLADVSDRNMFDVQYVECVGWPVDLLCSWILWLHLQMSRKLHVARRRWCVSLMWCKRSL